MLQGEHFAVLSTFIKLLVVIKTFILSIFEKPFTQVLLYLSNWLQIASTEVFADLSAIGLKVLQSPLTVQMYLLL